MNKVTNIIYNIEGSTVLCKDMLKLAFNNKRNINYKKICFKTGNLKGIESTKPSVNGM